jgi:hypothetical protein
VALRRELKEPLMAKVISGLYFLLRIGESALHWVAGGLKEKFFGL